ncbi:MAG: hypothetical protein JXB49_35755 [Bacteroidales bacterium]|nr:hypothetical protein [Bacteroidales bacterium]
MKILFKSILFILIITLSVRLSNAQTTPGSVEYMNTMVNTMDQLKGEIWQYLKAVTRGKGARTVENKRQALLGELKKSKSDIGKQGAFNYDDSLRQACIAYLDLSYTVLKEDFDKILDMEDIAEQSYDLMEAYLLAKEQANAKLDAAFKDLQNAHINFADKNNIKLVEAESDKTSQKIKKANDALKYYNVAYLIFFKCYKQEFYALDAMQRGDVSGLEQNAKTLVTYADEGLKKLDTLQLFHSDGNLKIVAQTTLRFYKKEGENDLPVFVDYYIKKDNFEKVKQNFDAKSKNSRTQEDVDQYNKAVNEFNTVGQKANSTSQAMDNERSKKIDAWNKAVDRFFETHTD